MQGERDRMVLDNMGLVKAIALKYRGIKGEPMDDLIQEGVLGLIKAVKAFNPSLGYAFSSLAAIHIRGAIAHYLRDCNPIKVPRDMVLPRPISLDATVKIQHSGAITVGETIGCPREDHQDDLISVSMAMDAVLSEQEKKIVKLVYFHGKTQKEIAKKVGTSPLTINRRLKKILKKLRGALI